MNSQINPENISAPAANYAHAVHTTGATEWLHTSGVVPIAPDGSVPDTIEEQALVVWRNIGAMMFEADMTPEHIVSVTTYATQGADLGAIMAARDAFMGESRAASTLVTVAALARPEWLFEVSVVAAK